MLTVRGTVATLTKRSMLAMMFPPLLYAGCCAVTPARRAASGNVQAAESARCELQAAIGQAKSAASAAQVAEALALALTSLAHDLDVGMAETTASIGYSLQDQISFWNQQTSQSEKQLAKVAGETSKQTRDAAWEKGAAEYKKNLIDEIWKIKRDRILKYIQYALDIASAVVCFIPGVGMALSIGLRAVSCVISIARGDYVGLAISLLPMGTIMKGAAKLVAPVGRLLFKPLIQGAAKLMPKAIDVAKGVLCGVGLRNGCFVAGTLVAVPADEDLYLAGGMDDMSGENSRRWDGKWALVGSGILVLAASAMYALQRRRAKRQGNCVEQDYLPGEVPARPEDRFSPEPIRVGIENLVFQG